MVNIMNKKLLALAVLSICASSGAHAAKLIDLDTISLDHISYSKRKSTEQNKERNIESQHTLKSSGVIKEGLFVTTYASTTLIDTSHSQITGSFYDMNFGLGYRKDLSDSKNKFADAWVTFGIGQSAFSVTGDASASFDGVTATANSVTVGTDITTISIGGRYGSNFDDTTKLFWTIDGIYSAKEDMYGDVGTLSASWGLMYAFTPSVSMYTNIGIAIPVTGDEHGIYDGAGLIGSTGLIYSF